MGGDGEAATRTRGDRCCRRPAPAFRRDSVARGDVQVQDDPAGLFQAIVVQFLEDRPVFRTQDAPGAPRAPTHPSRCTRWAGRAGQSPAQPSRSPLPQPPCGPPVNCQISPTAKGRVSGGWNQPGRQERLDSPVERVTEQAAVGGVEARSGRYPVSRRSGHSKKANRL